MDKLSHLLPCQGTGPGLALFLSNLRFAMWKQVLLADKTNLQSNPRIDYEFRVINDFN